MTNNKSEILKKETYLKAIENSVGSRMFSSLFMRDIETDTVSDILNNGEFSCAYFVSSVLVIMGVLDDPHVTVNATESILQNHNEFSSVDFDGAQFGDVVIWEENEFAEGSRNRHIGFVLNENEAVSTSSKEGKVISHHITYGVTDDGEPNRKIEVIYRWFKILK